MSNGLVSNSNQDPPTSHRPSSSSSSSSRPLPPQRRHSEAAPAGMAAMQMAHPPVFHSLHARSNSSHQSLPSLDSIVRGMKLPDPTAVAPPRPNSSASSPTMYSSGHHSWGPDKVSTPPRFDSLGSPRSEIRATLPATQLSESTPAQARPFTLPAMDVHFFNQPQRTLTGGFRDQGDFSSRASSSNGNPAERALCIGKRDVPGRGLCWLYNDGSTMPTEIDGHPVDPDLGVTKNFKARRRQAHACQHCREKKTRCEIDRTNPSRPCQACRRHGRDCIWEKGGRPGGEPPGKPSFSGERRDVVEEIVPRPRETRAISSTEIADDDTEEPSPKRRKYERDASVVSSEREREHSTPVAPVVSTNPVERRTIADPYQADPSRTMELLNLYFKYRDQHCVKMFPEQSFSRWVQNEKDKSPVDIMALNACLALGSIYCSDNRLRDAGTRALEACKKTEIASMADFTLQLAQARILLALYHWAVGRANESFEYTATCCRTLTAMSYNTEAGCLRDINEDPKQNPFGFTRVELAECRRRTFWSAFSVERFNGYAAGRMGLLLKEDIFVRLPNHEADYEAGLDTLGAPFNGGSCSFEGAGNMAQLAGILAIWGDTQAFTFRNLHRSTSGYVERFEVFYADACQRLTDWESTLPEELKANASNTRAALRGQQFAPYYFLQSFYHLTHMHLNRYCQFGLLPGASIRRNLLQARRYAREFLDIVATAHKFEPVTSADVENAISQPVPGFVNLVASDILSCGGPTSAFHQTYYLVGRAEELIRELTRFYKSGVYHRKLILDRMYEFGAQSMMHGREGRPWRFREALNRHFSPDQHDLVYGVNDDVYSDIVSEEAATVAARY